MITNATITVYNRYYDKVSRLDKWKRTVIEGAHVYVDNKVSLGDSGINSADTYKIRIPDTTRNSSSFVPAEQWQESHAGSCWTLQNDDLIVLAECVKEIERPADLQSLKIRYCKITSWSDNRFGNLPHWRIGGV